MVEQAETAATPQKSKIKVIVLAVVALIVVIALSVVGTWLILNKSPADSEQASSATAVAQQQAIYEDLTPAFVVNFRSNGKPRYLQVSVALMGRNKADMESLKIHMPTLRNQLVMLFSSQNFEALNTPLGIEMLKQKATVAVQELALIEVGKPVIEQVLFTNVVMQ